MPRAGDGEDFFSLRQGHVPVGDSQQLTVGVDGYGGHVLEKTAKLPDPKVLGQGNHLISGAFLQIRNPQPFVARSGVDDCMEDTGDGGLPIADLPAGFRPGEAAKLENLPVGLVECNLAFTSTGSRHIRSNS